MTLLVEIKHKSAKTAFELAMDMVTHHFMNYCSKCGADMCAELWLLLVTRLLGTQLLKRQCFYAQYVIVIFMSLTYLTRLTRIQCNLKLFDSQDTNFMRVIGFLRLYHN